MKNLRIATSALTRRIFLGKVTIDGSAFVGEKLDVTSDCLKAIIEYVQSHSKNTVQVHVDGALKYELVLKEKKA